MGPITSTTPAHHPPPQQLHRPRRGLTRGGSELPRQQGRRRPGEDERPVGGAPLVVTGDVELLDPVLGAAAAAGVEPTVTSEVGSLRPQWASAPMVLVGADRARQVAELVLPHRTEVYVVGSDSEQEDLWRWSAPLGAAVIGLPQGSGLLTAAIADVTGRPSGSGQVVAVVGGSGGVGASSVAAALAVAAVAQGQPAMLVDLDPIGGGIDLLVGAEGVAGWRWPRLDGAQGHLGDLTGHLPRIGGLDVLATARDVGQLEELQPAAVRAVLQSGTRSHRLVVLDLPRTEGVVVREALRGTDLTLLVVSADVRGVAAAQQFAPLLRDSAARVELVVRRPRAGGIEPALVSEALELPVAAVVGHDASLRQAAERGDLPGRVGRSQLGRASRRLLAELDVGAQSPASTGSTAPRPAAPQTTPGRLR